VHFNALSHPLVGDPTYGKRHSRIVFPRQALHAERLALVHPETRRERSWRAAPPADMQELLALLRSGDSGTGSESRVTTRESRGIK
jgi:23S rRNA pseudouridine1911/1915/1917 synthase